jgi:hypothetical protein
LAQIKEWEEASFSEHVQTIHFARKQVGGGRTFEAKLLIQTFFFQDINRTIASF